MMEFHVLPRHAAMALGVDIDQLSLPRSEYGVDAGALWVCPRFIEICRHRDAIARQMAERRSDIQPHLHHKPRTEEEVESKLSRDRQRRYDRKRRQRKERAGSV